MAKSYAILTFGCQMNEHDSEVMAGLLEQEGYQPTEDLSQADVILVNTCAIRENAEQRVFGRLGALKQYKLRNPGMILGMCGCMAQEKHVVARLQEHYPWVDLVFGTNNLHRLPELLRQAQDSRQPVYEIWSSAQDVPTALPVHRAGKHKAWVSIMYGCDKFCTYCIVPYVRGRERSREAEEILHEVEELVQEGVKEVTLLGQKVNAYGKEFQGARPGFAQLLRLLNGIDGLERIRFTSPYPRDFTEDVVTAMADSEKVCEHVHLPVQSGSNRVLRKMNRGYTREEYLAIVDRLRKAIPDIAITTDIIVGFPWETEQDFQETLSLVDEVGCDGAYTFIYSPRAGTPAAKWDERFGLPYEVRQERLERLNERIYLHARQRNEALVGQEVEVLVDGPSKTDPEVLEGRTRSNKLVLFRGQQRLTGWFVPVRITSAQTFQVWGEPVDLPRAQSVPVRASSKVAQLGSA
ncbi:MAG: tRNA (N6-isopentenyl adenosine(37)-C2)-methylthiotransferase MiaB [Firmicutes bacterium]|nr:tRNA (N6-isopentenyl adenosine(37)-C2)-methylthiotransferase MiaB [Bacillota bacterium]